MTTRLAPVAAIALALVAAWTLAGHLARADAPRVAASNYIKNSNSSATATPAWSGELQLPFAPGESWAYTGAPHMAWMPPSPSTALDFASNDGTGLARAVCPGTVTRADTGRLWLVCNGHETEVLYLHQREPVPVGTIVKAGDVVGTPACEGSDLRCNGPHIHLAVMKGGEWIVPTLSGWTFAAVGAEYEGTATGPGGETIGRMGEISW